MTSSLRPDGLQHGSLEHRRRKPATANVRLAAAGVGIVALAACSTSGTGAARITTAGSGGTPAPASVVTASAAKTLADRNARFHAQFTGNAAGHTVSVKADGIVDLAGDKLDLILTLPHLGGLGGTLEERVIHGVSYVKLPSPAINPGSARWIMADVSNIYGDGYPLLDAVTQNPAQLLSTLRTVSSTVATVGSDSVRGVPTTHYRAQLDLTKTADVTVADRTGLQRAQQHLNKLTGKPTIPFDVYIGDDQRTRRLSVTMTPAPGGSLASYRIAATTTVDFYDFDNADAGAITVPPADELDTFGGVLASLHD